MSRPAFVLSVLDVLLWCLHFCVNSVEPSIVVRIILLFIIKVTMTMMGPEIMTIIFYWAWFPVQFWSVTTLSVFVAYTRGSVSLLPEGKSWTDSRGLDVSTPNVHSTDLFPELSLLPCGDQMDSQNFNCRLRQETMIIGNIYITSNSCLFYLHQAGAGMEGLLLILQQYSKSHCTQNGAIKMEWPQNSWSKFLSFFYRL